MINRKSVVVRHNIHIRAIDYDAPIQLGNGNFCVSVDVTGFQNLYPAYQNAGCPLCTMAEWFWHSYPRTEEAAGNLVPYRLPA
jgi:hypothetical protein